MVKRKSTRSVNRTTLLVMGKDEHDKVFLSNTKGIYYKKYSDSKVTLDLSSNSSPRDVTIFNYSIFV